MKTYGIVGFPLAHCLSPAMHNAAFGALGIEAEYCGFETAVGDFDRKMERLRNFPIAGFNVTLPYKRAIVGHLDRLSSTARAMGAVNTVEVSGEEWIGHNTDGYGLVKSMECAGVSARDARVVILGAGGAAQAAAMALAEQRPASITVVARRGAQAEMVVSNLSDATDVTSRSCDFSSLSVILESTDLIVQATSATLVHGDLAASRRSVAEDFANELPLEKLPANATVLDIVYRPLETAVLRKAKRVGARSIGGLGMLLHQGARAFTLWTHEEAPLDAMNEALMKSL